MKVFSLLLKIPACVVGLFCIIYGFIVGFIGTGPDGPHHSIYLNLIGILIFFLGILYVWPTKNIIKNNFITKSYIIFTTLPPVLMLEVEYILLLLKV